MKKILIFLSACAVAVSANAQYSNYSSDSRFGDNWSLGIEGGVQTNLHYWNKPLGGVFGLNLNKDLSPYFGVSLEAIAGANNTGNWLYTPHQYYNGTAIDNLTGFVTGRWNITNSLCRFKGYRRVFEVETNVGVGYGKFFDNHKYAKPDGTLATYAYNAFQFKAGLNLNFYLGQARAWAINIRPAAVWNISQTGQFDVRNAVAQLTAGLTYHFKTSNGTHFFTKSNIPALEAEIAALAALNASLQEQLANQPAPEVVVEKVVEEVAVEVPKAFDSTYVVNFAWNSAELVGDAKTTLDKIPAGSTVTVAGYASPEGSQEYNMELSEKRADAVKSYLESRGVKVSKTVGYGADNAEANRIVIVNVQ